MVRVFCSVSPSLCESKFLEWVKKSTAKRLPHKAHGWHEAFRVPTMGTHRIGTNPNVGSIRMQPTLGVGDFFDAPPG